VIAAGRPLCEYCFAANNVRSVDKLSGRTTDRLGDIRPDTAHTIGGTTAVMNTGRSWSMGDAAATAGAAGRDRQRELRAGWSRVHRRGAAGAAGPSRDYGPAGSSGSLRRLNRGRTALLGTTGRTENRRRTHYGACSTGLLGYDRPDSVYTIGGTAELAIQYSHIP